MCEVKVSHNYNGKLIENFSVGLNIVFGIK